MPSLPTGTVTFLFTDIEGSTRLWEEHGEAMGRALQRHDEILRETLESNEGYVFSTAGDAFSAAFTDPGAALDSAIAIQIMMAEEDWGDLGDIRVRAALHTGVAHERDGDYFGPALNRAARMLSAGHGDQILLSLGTEEILGSSPNGATLKDLGEHTLKDLGRPERIFQVVADGLRDDFPPLQSLDAHPNNLPIQLTSFVGREAELNDVVKRLHDHRLLTLTGVGGSGKTRLAVQAAAESFDDYRHGVWLVELASIGDGDLIANSIGETLGLTRSQGGGGGPSLGADPQSVLDQVAGHLSSRTTLLVLDNCEHVITPTARVVQHLLQNCPDLTVLATSREGLGVPGESLWQVPSLEISSAASPLESDAVRLFVERAQDADARFEANSDTLAWVQRICERLDGMPLAIELAAARARVLDAKQIAERLDDRFRLLTGGSRTALPRHQTLEATVDWSYELMTDSERSLFQRLAAFRGGFTLEAAEAVCVDDSLDVIDVLDLVGSLVDKSMVVRDDITGRFRMLETLRQYALRRLTESDEVDAIRIKHADYFEAFIQAWDEALRDLREAEAYEAITHDHDNLRAAIAYCLENGREQQATRITARLTQYWWTSSDEVEGLDWLRKVMPYVEEVDTRTACTVLAFAGLFAGFRKDPDATSLTDSAIERARAGGDPYAEALAWMAQGAAAWATAEWDEAKEHALEMLKSAEESGDHYLIGMAHMFAGFSDRMMSRLDDVADRLGAAEAAFRRQGSLSGLGWVLAIGGQAARYRFDFETEIVKQREAREIFQRVGAPSQITFTMINEALALALLHRAEEAVDIGRRAIAEARERALDDDIIQAVGLLSWFEAAAGNMRESLDLIEETLRVSAPGLDVANLQFIAEHLMFPLASLGMDEEACVVDGFADANRNRPAPEIYEKHWEPTRAGYREALGDRVEGLRAQGAALSPRELHDYALAAVESARASL